MTVTSTHPPAEPGRPARQSRGGSGRWRGRLAVAVVGAVTIGGTAAVWAQQASAAVSVDTNAYYVIINASNGKALSQSGGSTASGGEIQQSARTDGANQLFQFVPSGSENYRLKNRYSGKVVEVQDKSTQSGAEVQENADTNEDSQQFSVTGSDTNHITLTNRSSDKVLAVSGSSAQDGTQVSQSSSNDSVTQIWILIKVGSTSDLGFPGFSGFPGFPSGSPSGPASTPSSSPEPTSTPSSSPEPTSTPSSTRSADDPAGNGSLDSSSKLEGWAAENGGTTGGSSNADGNPDSVPGDSDRANVSTASEFLSAINSSSARVVRLTANISLSGMHKVSSNKTIIGAGSGKTITGGGLNISGQKNVIIQNLNFTGWDDDAINVESNSTNVWIDHCSFSNGYDGTVDIKRGSDFITVSWNHVSKHDKSMLLGHSDNNGSQDTGHLHVTYHHNWFDGSGQRHPRVRFGNPVHVFNNYYSNITGYGVASTENAGVLVEHNYFENVKDPFHRGEGNSSAGSLVARDNYLTGSGQGDAGGSVKSIPYSYSPNNASSVKSTVTAGAGVGHLDL